MAHRSGNGLILAGTILTVIGIAIVLLKVWHIPEYWIPLMVGMGLLLLGLVRRLTAADPRDSPPRDDRR
jgi:mannose/fructose/N-acetylgalactosamine-specific phosphotransferase system component IIC